MNHVAICYHRKINEPCRLGLLGSATTVVVAVIATRVTFLVSQVVKASASFKSMVFHILWDMLFLISLCALRPQYSLASPLKAEMALIEPPGNLFKHYFLHGTMIAS